MLYNLKVYFLGITCIVYSTIILVALYNKIKFNYFNTCLKFNDNIKTDNTNIFHNSNNNKNIIDEITRINNIHTKIFNDHNKIIDDLHKKIIDEKNKLIVEYYEKYKNIYLD